MSTETNKEILEARKRMAEQFGDVKLGGKGIIIVLYLRNTKKSKNGCT